MDPRSVDGHGFDWNDPTYQTTQFDDQMSGDATFAKAFNDFTNIDSTYCVSPAGLALRTPSTSKSGREAASSSQNHQQPHLHHPQQPLPHPALQHSTSESSSQDSASDSSSRRKRKVTSESPMSDAMTEQPSVKQEDMRMDMGEAGGKVHAFDQAFTRPMNDLSLEQEEALGAHFDFNSAASSPNHTRDYKQNMSLNAQMNDTPRNRFHQSPVQTINPGMFQIGSSRDESPVANNMLFNNASPNAIFSTPSSDSNEAFSGTNWNAAMAQTPAWQNDFSSQFTSPGGLAFTPSPVVNGSSPVATTRNSAMAIGRSPLHIAPISTKSRVETQINIIMTLEKPPQGIEHLHLPLHTIAKSKLLAKEEYDNSKALELHAMLVSTSAMRNPQLKEKALRRATLQDNTAIQRRADELRDAPDEVKNDMKNVDEADKPANGGEVRICNNCIQRERKRAGRKKLKKEEEQQHWERFETERVVVFNSNEYLPFKPCEPAHREGASAEELQYIPPDGSLQVSAAMRIACYCRHQSEKEGFRVIFTLKDQQSHVVAQQISDSILITDDHKTHPPSFSAAVPGEVYYQNAGYASASNGLPTSYSMVDLQQQAHPFTASRSTGNLQALSYGQQQYNSHSHVHHMSSPGFVSQAASATMTPTSLSRPASPTATGQTGPNKKRKSSTFHRRLPSGLAMTRVDTSQPPSSNLPSAMSMPSSFSPTNASGFSGQNDSGYMTIPTNGGPAKFFGSGPPTPSNETAQYAFNQTQADNLARAQNAQAYFSHPSSRVPSRASSPVLQASRPNMAAYARHPIQTPTNSMQTRPQSMYGGPAAQASAVGEHDQSREPPGPPTITKITPSEGPTGGGTEVSIYGYNFSNGMQVMFGEHLATTVFYGTQALLATSPPSRPGGVDVILVPAAGNGQYTSPQSSRQIFTYTETNPRMMEMALRFLSQQQSGNQMPWGQFTTNVASQYTQNSMNPGGMRGGPQYEGGNMMSAEAADLEAMVLEVLSFADMSESPLQPCYDIQSDHGETMLSLACTLGLHRVAAALLARGANPDTRDASGFTPLMHAALQGRTKIFQLLIVKGADPTTRSLKGYWAMDLVSPDAVGDFQLILQNTPRSRTPRPSLHARFSFGSSSSKPDWDIASASFYESEVDGNESQHTVSRRTSEQIVALPTTSLQPDAKATAKIVPPAAMQASRDALTAQIHRFQQNVQWTLPHFQLPPLPALQAEYQDNAVVRRLSSLYSGRTRIPDVQSVAPPPAYTDLFPEKTAGSHGADMKKRSTQTANIDAITDEKYAAMFESTSLLPRSSLGDSSQCRRSRLMEVGTSISALPSWLGMPILVIITSIVMHIILSHVSLTTTTLTTRAFGGGATPADPV